MIGAHRDPKGGYTMRRDERPTARTNPGGDDVWIARYTRRDGKRKSAGTFPRRGPCKKRADDGSCCAQHRIWWAYEQDVPAEERPATVREYFEGTWLQRHPRSARVELNYRCRVRAVLEVKRNGWTFGDVPMRDVRVRHLDDLVDVMLRDHGRAASGTRGVIATLSSMFTDAVRDEVAEMNPALYITVRDNDPRIQRPKRKTAVLSWEEMHAFARAAGEFEPMVRTLADCGLRLGELLALECKHVRGDVLVVEQHAWRGQVYPGTKQGDRREVPLPPVLGSLLALAKRDVAGNPRVGLLFPNRRGKVWHERNFSRYVWEPTRERYGAHLNCHDFRHSYVSLMRAAGVDPADLAKMSGHTVATATNSYTHATGATFEAARKAVGE
jgi:integrase